MKIILTTLVVAAGACSARGQGFDLSRAYQAELRADAAARTSDLDGSHSGHDGKNFVLSDGGNNTLKLSGMIQERWTGNFRDAPGSSNDFTGGFSTRRARLDAIGTIADKRFSYHVRIEAGRTDGKFLPLEAVGRYDLTEQTYVRIGQFKLPLMREEWISATAQLASERSVMDTAFAESYSQGVEFGYQGENMRVFADVTDGLKTTSTDFTRAAEADYALTGRVEYKWAGKDWKWSNDFTSFRGSGYSAFAGLAGHWQAGGDTGGTTDVDFFQGAIDTQVEGDGWNLFAAGLWRHSQRAGAASTDDFGAILQGGVFVTEQTELFARWDAIFPDSSRGDPFHVATFGANYYVSPKSHALKITFDVGYFFNSTNATSLAAQSTATGVLADSEGGQWLLKGQMQVLF